MLCYFHFIFHLSDVLLSIPKLQLTSLLVCLVIVIIYLLPKDSAFSIKGRSRTSAKESLSRFKCSCKLIHTDILLKVVGKHDFIINFPSFKI